MLPSGTLITFVAVCLILLTGRPASAQQSTVPGTVTPKLPPNSCGGTPGTINPTAKFPLGVVSTRASTSRDEPSATTTRIRDLEAPASTVTIGDETLKLGTFVLSRDASSDPKPGRSTCPQEPGQGKLPPSRPRNPMGEALSGGLSDHDELRGINAEKPNDVGRHIPVKIVRPLP